MRFISTKTHAMLDYLMGILLVIVPIPFLAEYGAAAWVPIVAGAIMLIQSACTDYELGMMRLIPMPVHLAMDAVVGIVVAASPWIFGFSEVIWIPHVIIGVAEIGAALTTHLHPQQRAASDAGTRTRLPSG